MKKPILTRTIVPAAPGWSFIMFYEDKDENTFHEHPIVAWDIARLEHEPPDEHTVVGEVGHFVTPVTRASVVRLGNPQAIKRPDGQYELPGGYDIRILPTRAEAFKEALKVMIENEGEGDEEEDGDVEKTKLYQ